MSSDNEGLLANIRIGRLDTPEGVRRELSRLYRSARVTAGRDLTPGDASKLGHLLGALWRSMELSELERRISELEKRLK